MSYLIDEMFLCFLFLDIINRSSALQTVIRAISTNIDQLVMTFFLDFTIIYLYSIFSFEFIYDYFFLSSIAESNDKGENACIDMLQCYLNIINMGMRAGGGIADNLAPASYYKDNAARYYFRFFYDLSFYVLVNVIMINCVLGIIIDTFGQLRDEKNRRDEDINSRCFICNIDRYEFDRWADGFRNHTARDHVEWNYVYFIYGLEQKDPTEYNGIESYVAKKNENEDCSWFPMLRALSIPEEKKENIEEIISGKLKNVVDEIKTTASKLDKMDKTITKLSNAMASAKSAVAPAKTK
eukprot:TRINITY_DN3754_c0_g1_i4.p1 TRINITY_DN3754_c0_g1~~TRINITY_DN3754_c0_g1_i4.p1  ORF type:complete len:296 (-),score=88.04 TRINITY_DN3754_c0_g1_i4:58-945(-)